MTETFADLFEESIQSLSLRTGNLLKGRVIAIEKDVVMVDAGLKSESPIAIDQFKNSAGELEVAVGDEVEVSLDAIEDGFGETILSREKAKRFEAWQRLEAAYEQSETVTGIISGRVKGGFTVELEGIRAFLPGSLVDLRPVRDTSHLEGKVLEFKVIKLDQKRNNVVVSRRSIIESETSVEREQLLTSLQEGALMKGVVKNLTDYGAFIDLGGIDGLLHITDMAWRRVKHPGEVVNVGDSLQVKVLKFDAERMRVSLGLKQLGEDPWQALTERYPIGSKLTGKVTNLTDYGCFVEIEDGVEGLVHVSEMDWTNKNVHPSKLVSVGDTVQVVLLDIDESRRRVSLGLKQCLPNPWQLFAEQYAKGEQVQGKIKSITDFGIFVGLDGGIDGLVHLSDLSWEEPNESTIAKFKRGDTITAVVLQVDAERERISLGIKQLETDPFAQTAMQLSPGDRVHGTVQRVDTKGVLVQLDSGIQGYLKQADLERGLSTVDPSPEIGQELTAYVSSVDKKHRLVLLVLSPEVEVNESKKEPSNKPIVNTELFSNAMTKAFKAAESGDSNGN